MQSLQIGDKVPAQIQLFDGATNKYVRAWVRDANNVLVGGAPINLTHISNGLYSNLSLSVPPTYFLTIQYIVYEDSGYTTIDPTEGCALDQYAVGAQPQVGTPIPLYIQTFDANPSVFPTATMYNDSNVPIGSPIPLAEIQNGLYGYNTFLYPANEFVTAQLLIWQDSGHTVLDEDYSFQSQVFVTGSGATATAPTFYPLVGQLDADIIPGPNDVQDEIIIGEDRVLAIRIQNGINQEPFDLTGVTNIALSFLNVDNSVLVVQTTDPSVPINVTSAPAGKFTCALSAAQTGNLMMGNPAPFSIALTFPSGLVLCNMPYQLQISPPSVGPFS